MMWIGSTPEARVHSASTSRRRYAKDVFIPRQAANLAFDNNVTSGITYQDGGPAILRGRLAWQNRALEPGHLGKSRHAGN